MTQRSPEDVASELAIRDLVARYADAVNRGDAAAWSETWAEDGCWSVAGRSETGREKVVELWHTLMGGLEWVVQLVHTGTIEIDADRATARWYLTELNRTVDGTAGLLVGVYHDECVCENGQWLFKSRRFDFLYAGKPDVSGAHFPVPEI